jgi:2-dehydropantoate 2-reductase
MRIVVVGAGAIGSYLGAALAMDGHQVGLLGRAGYVARVRERGVTVAQGGVERVVTGVTAAERIEDLVTGEAAAGFDLAIVTVKAFDTAEAARLLQPFVSAGRGRVVLIQNGVGGDEIAAGLLPPSALVTGVTTAVVAVRDMAHYEVRGKGGGLCLAPYVPEGAPVEPLVAMFQRAGVRCRACPDGRAIRWSKLLLNMMANAVPAITGLSPAEVYAEDLLYALEAAAVREALAVMHAAGVRPARLPGYPVDVLAWLLERAPQGLARALLRRMVGGARGGKKPSLQIDLERGRSESEVTYLNGAVAREAARLGLPAPVNGTIAAVLEGLAAGTLEHGAFRHSPQALAERAAAAGWRVPAGSGFRAAR